MTFVACKRACVVASLPILFVATAVLAQALPAQLTLSTNDAQGFFLDQALKQKQDEQKKQLADSRAMLAQLPADQRAQMETIFKQTETQMSDPAYVAMMRQGIELDRANAQKQYQEALADWQKNYPADSRVLIARRLQLFLNVSADVDFTAKLQGTGTSKTFVNPDYQQKPSDWKMCYRAGKESVDVARAAVADWLKALPKP